MLEALESEIMFEAKIIDKEYTLTKREQAYTRTVVDLEWTG